MTDVKTLIQQALEALIAGGATSATLATRDGLPVVHKSKTGSHPDTFAAMAAAVLGASEAAMLELGNSHVQHTIVDAKDAVLGVVGIDDGFILVTAATSRDALLLLFASGVPALQECLKQ